MANSRLKLIRPTLLWIVMFVISSFPTSAFAKCGERRCAIEKMRDISRDACETNRCIYQGSSRFQLRVRQNQFKILANSGRIPCSMTTNVLLLEERVVIFTETMCTVEEVDAPKQCDKNTCYYEGFVRFQLRGLGKEFNTLAKTGCIPCALRMGNPLNTSEGANGWDQAKLAPSVQLLTTERESQEDKSYFRVEWVILAIGAVGVIFFLCFMVVIFRNELIRICPRFILTAFVNIRRVERRTSSRVSTPLSQRPDDFVSPPPPIASRRRISKLIEISKLPASEAKALREGGWSCCICLEDIDEAEQLRPVALLKCNHATHSECLRLWLETGRAACCLCNADVFSDGTKEPSFSSRGSSVSDGDAGYIGSLVVERTDRTPSSPGTSVFIDASQPYSDTAPSNDEHDGDIERGL